MMQAVRARPNAAQEIGTGDVQHGGLLIIGIEGAVMEWQSANEVLGAHGEDAVQEAANEVLDIHGKDAVQEATAGLFSWWKGPYPTQTTPSSR